MKKRVYLSTIVFLIVSSTNLCTHKPHIEKRDNNRFNVAFTAGYVFKFDDRFKEIYGHGMANAITADFSYYPWNILGVGAKCSYWRSKGRTAFLQLRSIAQEIPFIVYARGIKTFDCALQLYGSLGGGFAWIKEKSYLGSVQTYKGLGEIEVGLNSPIWHRINLTFATRYLFPPQCFKGDTANIGGFDIRAGIGVSF